jgi:hypothetical protein
MRKYAGQYVVVVNGKVVASGKNPYKRIRELAKKHPEWEIVVTYIQRDDLLILAY